MKVSGLILTLCILIAFGCSTNHRVAVSHSKSIEKKYARLLEVSKEDIANKKLFLFIDEWYGTPYKYGGKTKKGTDCSGFTGAAFKEVYGKELAGSSLSMYNQCRRIPKEELREGDLVFFKIGSKEVSHVGIYLQNNKFVHATTKAGVMIDDLDEDYYKKYFFNGGRIL